MPEFREVPDEYAARGALPLASFGGIRWWISYSVPIGFAIVALAVAMGTFGPGGTSDLPGSAALATGFWVSGWLAQSIAFVVLCRLFGSPTGTLRIGLLGVEALPRIWAAHRALIVAVGTILPLLILGMFFRWVEGGFRVPQLAPADDAVWSPPSVGFKSHESIWLTGAWLCWVQAILQMIPFPRTPGRQLISALVVFASGSVPESMQRRLLQRILVVLALAIVILAIPMMASDDPQWSSKWPLLLTAGVLLWASSRSGEVFALIGGMQGSADEVDRGNFVVNLRQTVEQWRTQRRLQRALARERGEAVDAQRLDDILNRLHRDGVEALSGDDRKILDRVSESLRKEREENRLGE